MRQLKLSTAKNVVLKLFLASDHVSAATGKTLTVTVSKDGNGFGAIAGSVTEISSGWYKVALAAADLGTLGDLVIRATAAACDDAERLLQVVSYDPQDAAALGLTNIGAITPTANQNADALLDRTDGIETSWTFRQAMRIMLAVLGGKLSGAATATAVMRDIGDSKARVTATTDASGNRSAITYDKT